MASISPKIPLPKSYKDLPFKEILLTHIPADSPTPTPTILVTLHRPGRHNAFTDTMMNELVHAFGLIDVDPRVKCAIVTGHGKIFCAGADLASSFKGGEEPVREHRDGGGRVALAIHRCRKPVIGALQGSAVGIGITMTLPMSIRIAYEGAKIGFVFARRGIIMEACSSFYLPRLIGYVVVALVVTVDEILTSNQDVQSPPSHDDGKRVPSITSITQHAVLRDFAFSGAGVAACYRVGE
jgi:enoyl-CoA hydratase/carnithine racemase